MTTAVRIPAYRLHDPALSFPFPWVISASGAQWLDALVHQAPWNRCEVEQGYFPNNRALHDANREVPGLEGLTVEAWYRKYTARVEELCEG